MFGISLVLVRVEVQVIQRGGALIVLVSGTRDRSNGRCVGPDDGACLDASIVHRREQVGRSQQSPTFGGDPGAVGEERAIGEHASERRVR